MVRGGGQYEFSNLQILSHGLRAGHHQRRGPEAVHFPAVPEPAHPKAGGGAGGAAIPSGQSPGADPGRAVRQKGGADGAGHHGADGKGNCSLPWRCSEPADHWYAGLRHSGLLAAADGAVPPAGAPCDAEYPGTLSGRWSAPGYSPVYQRPGAGRGF